jgi:riboflavin kinase/FMN adenylyltransferase
MKILRPGSAPLLLTSNRHKLRLLGKLDLDGCLLMPFTRELSRMEPEAFVELLSRRIPDLAHVLVGQNWRFGREEKGDARLLVKLARKRGIEATIVAPVFRKERVVSSTRIRAEVACGNLGEAGAMLGRPYSILGTVIHGRAAGRRMGFPTANLETYNEVLPPAGVYAVHALVGKRLVDGVVNIGTRPTFLKSGGGKVVMELHLMDLNRNLYGEEIEVFFAGKLRNERKFTSVARLKHQIALDVKKARNMLARKSIKNPFTSTGAALYSPRKQKKKKEKRSRVKCSK